MEGGMFLKRLTRTKDGKRHQYWALVESVRTARGPRHRVVTYLGELRAGQQAGWAEVRRLLDQVGPDTMPLFPETEPVPEAVHVHLRGVRVQGVREFGDVYLGWRIWQMLKLDECLSACLPSGREDVPWSLMAAVLTLARFCDPTSELATAERWYPRTALAELLGIPVEQVNPNRLYRTLDAVLPHKAAIERHLGERFRTLFDASLDLVLYDLTSTYFEGEEAGNPQAKRGYSRDGRPDCVQVVIALVVTREGLPLSYDVFAGNRPDVTTLEDVVAAMEAKHGAMQHVWVVDRGIASEKNLAFLRSRGASYVVGTPKSRLKGLEGALVEGGWAEAAPGVEVKAVAGPDGTETFVVCRSKQRALKEHAMHERFRVRIEAGLTKLAGRLGTARRRMDRGKVERQVGRLLERNAHAGRAFEIRVEDTAEAASGLKLMWTMDPAWAAWAQLTEGHYLLRTNLVGWTPEALWQSYIQLTQAEAAFRAVKSDLAIRPIWHQREERVQAHILFSFLAFALWKTLEQWMKRSGLGSAPRPLREEMARLKVAEVRLPTSTGREVSLQCVTQPDPAQQQLLARLGLKLPQRLGQPRWVDAVPPAPFRLKM
jgi:hypothetical protein